MPVVWRRVLIFIVSLLPAGWLLWATLQQQLGADPAKTIVLTTGLWGIRFLLITLSVTPLVRLAKWRWLMIHRRMLGLFSLFYLVLHVLAYYQFILGGDLAMLGSEIVKRPYILLGMPALVIVIALGVTSTKGWMKRLGKNWQRLHRWVYLAIILGWIHLALQIRSSYFDAVLYGSLTVLLLGYRVYDWRKKRSRQPLR
jgi:sulfoxide reductase heme-binding subunit YedZ